MSVSPAPCPRPLTRVAWFSTQSSVQTLHDFYQLEVPALQRAGQRYPPAPADKLNKSSKQILAAISSKSLPELRHGCFLCGGIGKQLGTPQHEQCKKRGNSALLLALVVQGCVFLGMNVPSFKRHMEALEPACGSCRICAVQPSLTVLTF